MVWYHFMRLHCSRTFKKGWLRETQCVSCNPRFICNVPILSLWHLRWNVYSISLSLSFAANIYFPLTSNSQVMKTAGIARIIELKRLNETIWIEIGRMCRSRQNKIIVIWCQFFLVKQATNFFFCFTESFEFTCFLLVILRLEYWSIAKKTFYIIQWNRR